ncbi:spermatogenesis associated 6-like protein [Mycetomoellerius zeteki]|uniref:spermatogenesis associated 6-like protein n=1 Tax=Mycetomoellerius zeteki TaxID=64791 RepID=UPI00084E87A0|nr:PREDICTED: spermatogenesis associated 6-like protein [Trachymyrmex zeteki]XP_018316040.1 PREDICTED: spermatogenesis associated 6-like protein [Trachymyrmex zeteki]
MTGRAFRIKVQLNVHAVTCPGVWLCPNGKVVLRINALDSCAESHAISPILPLLFHEKFTFDKIFVGIISLTELQNTLEQEFLYAELIQWAIPASRGITLATFETNLAELLYPAPCFKGLLAGVDVDLLMEPTKCFPGIIAPKIEVSTKTVIEEILEFYDTSKCYVINPKMISKQTTCGQKKRPIKGIIRQRRVCHAKYKPRSQSCRPFRQRSSDSHQCPSYTTNYQAGSQSDQCYHSIRRNSMCTCQPDFPKLAGSTIIRDNTHVTDNCPVCFKYNYYFPKYNDCDIIKKYVDTKQKYCRNLSDIRECGCICRNGAFDTQEEGVMPLLQSKIENLQKTKKKRHTTEMTDNIEGCDPKYEYIQDYSPSYGFYKDLEKFYKRMYKQAKMRARETDD